MPTYEYQCPEGHVFEKFQKMTDKPRAKCPVCGKPATRKISGGAGLVFKGSGFYITDYGKDGKYHEYTHDYKNDEGYQYWEGSYHKGGKDYDYDYGKYVEHTDSHDNGDYYLSTDYSADHTY